MRDTLSTVTIWLADSPVRKARIAKFNPIAVDERARLNQLRNPGRAVLDDVRRAVRWFGDGAAAVFC